MESENTQNHIDDKESSEELGFIETTSASDPIENAEYVPSEIDAMPAIANWENAPGFSVLGVVISFLFGSLFYALPVDIYVVIFMVLSVLYALIFYRSYFTEKPLVKSSKVISFLNFAFMGIVFGWCFNNNIRRSKYAKRAEKGTSYIVAIILMISVAGGSFYYYNFTTSGYIAKNYDHNPRTGEYTPKSGSVSGQSSTKSSSSSIATIPSTSTTIRILDNWECQTYNAGSGSDMTVLVIFASYANPNTALLVKAMDMSKVVSKEYFEQIRDEFDIHNISEEAVLEDNRSNMDSVETEAAEIVQLNGIDYWKVQTLGTYSGMPLKETTFFCVVGSNLYQFTLSSYNESESTNVALEKDQEKMVESTVYKR